MLTRIHVASLLRYKSLPKHLIFRKTKECTRFLGNKNKTLSFCCNLRLVLRTQSRSVAVLRVESRLWCSLEEFDQFSAVVYLRHHENPCQALAVYRSVLRSWFFGPTQWRSRRHVPEAYRHRWRI